MKQRSSCQRREILWLLDSIVNYMVLVTCARVDKRLIIGRRWGGGCDLRRQRKWRTCVGGRNLTLIRYIKIRTWLQVCLVSFCVFGLVFFVLKSFLGNYCSTMESRKKLILTLKLPWSHVRILIHRTWAICRSELSVKCLSVYHNIRSKPLVPFRKITHVICMPHELHIYQLNSYVLFYFWLKKRKVKFHMC